MSFTSGRNLFTLILLILGVFTSPAAPADAVANKIGIVLMHGKGGSPTKYVADLASALEGQGFLVANLEMPWSGKRSYDVEVGAADGEVESALNSLRGKGARTFVVAGHSQGGLFALHFGGKHAVDGVIAIAPGGNVGAPTYRDKLGEHVDRARKLVAEGKGQEKERFADFEGSRGTYPIITTPVSYLSWFDPDGAMNQKAALSRMSPAIPVLFIAPTNDYPGLLKVKQEMFDALPRNPRTRLYEPSSSHLDAPSASIKTIIEWTTMVANAKARE